MRRETGQLSLAEALVRPSGKGKARLERIAALLDWSALQAELAGLRAAPKGRPAYPPIVMFRVLLLAQWYGLSDPEMEEALGDRLSFRRFAGLALDEAVPDETTICRFRGALAENGLAGKLFTAVNAQLAAQGLMLRRGTLIDASLVEADAAVRKGADGQLVTVDREAGFAQRRGKAFYGYKAHVAVDEGSELVRVAVLTPAHVHDSVPADRLICGDETAVYADKAYHPLARRAGLAARGIEDRIMRQALRNHPLTPDEIARNKAIARVRCAVERRFGTLKRSYGWSRVRYRGLRRNQAHLHLLCTALNLRRAIVLGA
jgi:IS5 family transposase